MNRVYLIGNLTRDPDVRTVSDRLTVADLGLAVNESYRGKDGNRHEVTCFVDVTTWNGQAKACGDALKKGMPVMVEGKLQLDQWQDKDGNNRSKLKVKADRVQFLRRAPKADQAAAA